MALSGLTALSSPLDERQLVGLNAALSDLSTEQVAWVSGYLAGLSLAGAPAPAKQRQAARGLTILYGTQTGNARSVAEALGERALAQGFDARVLSTADFKPRGLTKERLLLLVVSTQGEGEPPESALDLHAYLTGNRAPRLEGLRYAVLGLGDSSYEHFCQTAIDFDARLADLGAERLAPLATCDLIYEEDAKAWSESVLEQVGTLTTERGAEVVALPGVRLGSAPKYDKDSPYSATLLERRRITTEDAVADVRHVVLGIDPDALSFAPGDSLGVRFRNDPELVEEILASTGADGDEHVVLGGEAMELRRALGERLELTQLHPAVVKAWAHLAGGEELEGLVEDAARLRAYAADRQLIDLLADYPGRVGAPALAGLVHPLQPRLYSIASSQEEIADEVHLTVSNLAYLAHGRHHKGAASGYLSERLVEEAALDVYVVENPAFRLPRDGQTPVIMIGAGTGIAPYRAFMQQRALDGAGGRNWLIFGNRHFRRDFLYQLDWQAFRKAGLLNRVSTAFSRECDGVRYVQHRLEYDGAEVYRWLAEGANLYVCGSTVMGQEVQSALVNLVAREAGLDRDAAGNFVENLRREGRYHRDLY